MNRCTYVHDKKRRTPPHANCDKDDKMNISLREQKQMRQLVGIEDIENKFSDARLRWYEHFQGQETWEQQHQNKWTFLTHALWGKMVTEEESNVKARFLISQLMFYSHWRFDHQRWSLSETVSSLVVRWHGEQIPTCHWVCSPPHLCT